MTVTGTTSQTPIEDTSPRGTSRITERFGIGGREPLFRDGIPIVILEPVS